jgi:hypothetical protein
MIYLYEYYNPALAVNTTKFIITGELFTYLDHENWLFSNIFNNCGYWA